MKRKSAFTLVELLVVISVMAVLIAILIPALSSARQIAYKITCLNNLKQLGIAVQTYAQQYKVYPICVSDVNVTWSEFTANPDIAKNKMLGVPVSLWPFHQGKNIYNCPILARKKADISYCYDSLAGREYTASQTAVASITPYFIPPTTTETKKEYDVLMPERVKSPNTFVILYDLPIIPEPLATADDANIYHNIDPDDYDSVDGDESDSPGYLWKYEDLNADGPHSTGFNILFADSHVKWHKQWSDSEMTRKSD